MPVSIHVSNGTAEPWDSAVTVSYQVFDAETDRIVIEGPRTPLPRTLAPGDSADIELDLPSEPGRYRVFVSAMREGICWYYERGVPFLVAEIVDGRVVRQQVTTFASVRRKRRLRSVGRAFAYPLRSIWANRSLIGSMVRRDILGRYRGSFGGLFWTVLNPALLMLTYFFVFGIVLRARFAGDPSRAGFALYFLCGMLPWLAFSEAAGRAPWVVIEHRNFVKKLVFPIETLPVNLAIAGLVTQAFALLIFCLFLLASRGAVPLTVAWLPVILVPQVLFTMGVAWFLAATGAYVRDLAQVNGFLLTLWFFITPICYPEEALPPEALGVLSANPMYVLVRAYRDIFLEGRAPAFDSLWKLWVVAIVVFIAGYAWFHKLKSSFADAV
ncbi:MAG TPA: ABC transporter permease [Bryobacteraceae bacterium]|nr:ABC transporter permease [Bryobacteraceae bacterium]